MVRDGIRSRILIRNLIPGPAERASAEQGATSYAHASRRARRADGPEPDPAHGAFDGSPPRQPDGSSTKRTPRVQPARRAAQALARAKIGVPRPPTPARVALVGDFRLRDLGAPFPTLGGAVRGGLQTLERWGFFGQARFEAGRAERRLGNADLRAFFLGGGATFSFARLGAITFDTSGVVSAGWMGLRGRSRRNVSEAGATDSFTAEIDLAAGPTLPIGPVDLGLDLEMGAMLRAPLGIVYGPEPDVSPGGPWLGVALRVGTAVP